MQDSLNELKLDLYLAIELKCSGKCQRLFDRSDDCRLGLSNRCPSRMFQGKMRDFKTYN